MSEIDYERFTRVLKRCEEIAADPEMPKILALVYKERTEPAATAYLAACDGVLAAATAYAKEHREELEALEAMDGPYRVARSAVTALLPDSVLPATLKSQRTDTDKLNAIERLLDLVDDHIGKPWADELLAGELGQQAPKTIKEQKEAIAANKALFNAGTKRAAAYGPAYEAYLAFKRLVRDARGPASKEYRRIHLRASPGAAEQDELPPVEVKVADEVAKKTAELADSNAAPAANAAPAVPNVV